ncbi:hypothetical protein G6M85_23605 [Agrobacterium tumefaciens]|jgi:hypothetical protein|nr:hypothetical protein [Agrobacterium tumefaciens]NTE68580.1 hypothetical protein [Agrobacterium tumefaciens]
MREIPVLLTLTISTREPIELGDFVGQFVSLGNEFARYLKEDHPDLKSDNEFFIKDIRTGSIVAELIPAFAIAAPFISQIDQIMIVEDFVRRWGNRISGLVAGKPELLPDTKSELKDFTAAVAAIAKDPNASATLEAATFEDGKQKIRASFRFNTTEARQAEKSIQIRRREIEAKASETFTRVLMVFTRSDINDANIGKPSGEKVKIQEISDKPVSLVYASEMAEQQIKKEVREADDNIFKKGFIVDVAVKYHGDKAAAYALMHVHSVIDLPDE